MKLTPRKIHLFLLWKLPSAFFTGVRVREISSSSCVTTVKHRWINQNPFRSMFWAVQGMAAELSTGALVMNAIRESGADISMLVTGNKAEYFKKARGRIDFDCRQGAEIISMVEKAKNFGGAETIILISEGRDKVGALVSRFEFEWSLKARNKNEG